MSRLANLGSRIAAVAPETMPDDEPAKDSGGKKKDEEMKDDDKPVEQTDAFAAGHTAGLKEANARMNAVFASDEYAGREKLAHTLLNKGMAADDIIETLASATKVEPAAIDHVAVTAAAEEAARAEMRGAMDAEPNSGANDGGEKPADAAPAAIWDKAIEANNPGLKLK
jgi:hypothetical protein